jgi:hypothetical protein
LDTAQESSHEVLRLIRRGNVLTSFKSNMRFLPIYKPKI